MSVDVWGEGHTGKPGWGQRVHTSQDEHHTTMHAADVMGARCRFSYFSLEEDSFLTKKR